MVTLAATIALLQMMAILPTMGICRTCKVPTPKWKEENWIFWECSSCPSASGEKNIKEIRESVKYYFADFVCKGGYPYSFMDFFQQGMSYRFWGYHPPPLMNFP
jgi:hypothetical protein